MKLKSLEIILNDYCIGCGICAINGTCMIYMDKYGKYQAKCNKTNDIDLHDVLETCPFSDYSANEEIIGNELFKDSGFRKNDYIGYYLNNYIGYTKDNELRLHSSSGGIISWLLLKLLSVGEITHVIHVGRSETNQVLFEYKVSQNKGPLLNGASSKYYPIEMSSILKYIKQTEGQYAIVALPCFSKAIRLLQKKDDIFRKRIKYIISPFCGHLKTKHYSTFLAMQKGITDEELETINFRKKIPGRPSSQYGTEFSLIRNKTNSTIIIPNKDFKMGTDWGHGMFKYPACDYCDDVVGELADLSVGDAWLPKYIGDYKGNSVLVIRNVILQKLLNDGVANKELHLEEISIDSIYNSQAGGYRNKREDLSYRLWLKKQKGEWYPPKRVVASDSVVSNKRKGIINMRLKISSISHDLFLKTLTKNNIQLFFDIMTPLLNKYYIKNRGVLNYLKLKIKQIIWR